MDCLCTHTSELFVDKETGEYKFNPDEIKIAHQWCKDEVENKMKRNQENPQYHPTIVVSNTFTQEWEMDYYFSLSLTLGKCNTVILNSQKKYHFLEVFINMSLKETIKRILREESKPIKVMRRTHEIDREFKRLMSSVYRPNSICRYDDGSELFQVVFEGLLENIYFNTFLIVSCKFISLSF